MDIETKRRQACGVGDLMLLRILVFLILFAPGLRAQAVIVTNLGACSTGQIPKYNETTKQYDCATEAGGGVPAGLITITLTSCPAGWTEVASLNGKTLFGTLVANADVGTTGGSDSITPTVNSLTAAAQTPLALSAAAQTVSSLTAAAQTFTGSASTVVVNHLHTLATGTGSTGNFSQVIGTVDTSSGGTGGTPTQTALGTRTGNPVAGGAADYTPSGTNGTSAVTGTMNSSAVTGTMNSSAVTGTLNSLDNRSAYVKVVFCSKN